MPKTDDQKPKRSLVASSVQPMDIYVGSRIKLRRAQVHMSALGLATRMEKSRNQLEKWERGQNRISAGDLFYISEILEIDPGWFFKGFKEGGPANEGYENLITRDNVGLVMDYSNLLPDQRKALKLIIDAMKRANLAEARELEDAASVAAE